MDYDKLIDFLFEISNEAMELGKNYPGDIHADSKVNSKNLCKFNKHYFKIYEFAKEHGKIGGTNETRKANKQHISRA